MSAAAATMIGLLGADPASYRPHSLHAADRAFIETNCYTDIWIELLHAAGHEPLAAMGATLRVDFEGDQWTFFKPSPESLEDLYGIDVHEMQPYRPLPAQVAEQLAQGRTLLIEVDAWYLPDTEGRSYRAQHVKSSLGVEGIDLDGERLRYFHGAGLHELSGEDYRGVFRLGRSFSADVLPPYVELVRFDAGRPLHGDDLRAAARALLRRNLDACPARNPFLAFGSQLEGELVHLLEGELDVYHAYAFATSRMVGSAFEIAASHVAWVCGESGRPSADALRRIVDGAKLLTFRLARRRAFDLAPTIAELAAAWDEGMARLHDLVA